MNKNSFFGANVAEFTFFEVKFSKTETWTVKHPTILTFLIPVAYVLISFVWLEIFLKAKKVLNVRLGFFQLIS